MQGISTSTSTSASTAPSPSSPLARKRPRPNSFAADDVDITLIGEVTVDNAKVVRDSEYYKEGADCRIRVEDTLFCIHRFLLERDSPTFQAMFQLPQGGEQAQGSTDEDPIVLTGDTVEQFRSLCWALYALPDETAKENETGKSMEKLVDVATISHKYQLAAFQAWSMASIRRQCEKTHQFIDALGRSQGNFSFHMLCPSKLLPTYLRLFLLYGDDALMCRVTTAWIRRLNFSTCRNELRPPLSAFADAFVFAEQNELRQFLGRLYYSRLRVAHHNFISSGLPLAESPFAELEPGSRHVERLFRGCWSLSAYWQQLITSIPELPNDRCQQHPRQCRVQWNRMWAEASAVGGATDVLVKLQHLNTELGTGHTVGVMTVTLQTCAEKGKVLVESLITKLQDNLPDFFLGPP
ncbi:hypothetical protein C8R47DRAFT_584971 [Mycena vitilis]|nr:hypothetical protein C8R47DRAFT_584971 [Mycena vitilis]